MKTSVAIVTTLKKAADVIDSFLHYHLSIGFDRIFLFFDDPHDPCIAKARLYEGVTIFVRDEALQARWHATRLYQENPECHSLIDSVVMVRQMLNVQLAIEMAPEYGIDWLLHIDVDELFYSPDLTVQAHFDGLAAANVPSMHYLNYEAIVETFDTGDFFKEVTLFRKNGGSLSDAQLAVAREHAGYRGENVGFNFYTNGKSAARVTPHLQPAGVHGFTTSSLSHACRTPFILHYPVCGFRHFMDKYWSRKYSPDGLPDALKSVPIALESVNVANCGDRARAEAFFRERIMVNNQAHIDDFLANDIFCRITQPSRML